MTDEVVDVDNRVCAFEGCDKILVRHDRFVVATGKYRKETPFMFAKRRYCGHSCSNAAHAGRLAAKAAKKRRAVVPPVAWEVSGWSSYDKQVRKQNAKGKS